MSIHTIICSLRPVSIRSLDLSERPSKLSNKVKCPEVMIFYCNINTSNLTDKVTVCSLYCYRHHHHHHHHKCMRHHHYWAIYIVLCWTVHPCWARGEVWRALSAAAYLADLCGFCFRYGVYYSHWCQDCVARSQAGALTVRLQHSQSKRGRLVGHRAGRPPYKQ